MTRAAWAGAALLAFLSGCTPQGAAQEKISPDAILDRAIEDFRAGRIAESIAGFDNVVKLVPGAGPELWQRGIALYYAGRYKDCRAQFESHLKVNRNDVEVPVWHYLCVAREETPAKARAALLPVGSDPRVPMPQVYDLFRGTLKPEDVLKAGAGRPSSEFYAELYVGLYFEAQGDAAHAREHITLAAADRFASVGGYMHMVARVHLAKMAK